MTVRIWGANSVEQCTVGSLLPANAKPYNVEDVASYGPAGGVAFSRVFTANEDFYLQTVVGQVNVAAVFTVKVGSTEVAWGRTSTAEPTMKLDYGTGYIKVPAGETLTVEVVHWGTGVKDFYINIGGGLVTGN